MSRSNHVLLAVACLAGGIPTCVHGQVVALHPTVARQVDGDLGRAVIVDGVADARGHVLLLDNAGTRVIVADDSLRFLGQFGQRGDGTGEFWDPVSLEIAPDGRVAVLDAALGRVTLFRLPSRLSDAVAEQSFEVNVRFPEAMCVLPDGSTLIYGPADGKRLHLHDPGGGGVRSFAPPDPRYSRMAQDQLTKGRIACDPDRDEVVVSSELLPTVEVFRISSGEPIWQDAIPSFRATRIIDRGGDSQRRSVTLQSGRAGYSRIESVFHLGDERVFQSKYDGRQDGVLIDTVVTSVYAADRHAWLPSSTDLPVLIPLGDGRALGVEEDVLTLYTVGVSGGELK